MSTAAPLPLERSSTASRVAAALREELLAGLHAPGTPMRDVELAARAGVSRPTMREALAELARDGLLVHALHRGMEVARLETADVRDIYAARLVIEQAGLARLRAGSRAASATAFAPLLDAAAEMADAEDRADRRRTVEADARFHDLLALATGSTRLARAHAAAMLELRLVLSVTDRAHADVDRQAPAHRRLAMAMRDGTAPEARDALTTHLLQAQERVCAVIDAQEATG